MQNCDSITQLDAGILADIRWNRDEVKPLLMHSVHVYQQSFLRILQRKHFVMLRSRMSILIQSLIYFVDVVLLL